uniref:Uncharacterized protein n=1 Tax=Ixodes ricinus TaxID=34613 RepID=A0A6B0TSP7_IXORI
MQVNSAFFGGTKAFVVLYVLGACVCRRVVRATTRGEATANFLSASLISSCVVVRILLTFHACWERNVQNKSL